MRIAIVGAGYVGLTTAAGFADAGHDVTVVDTDTERIARLATLGTAPFFEPGLDDQIKRCSKRLSFTADYEIAIKGSDFAFICVGTPQSETGKADLSAVLAASREVSLQRRGMLPIAVVKSTVPPGTCDLIREETKGELRVLSNPEFLKEGTAVEDFAKPDRVVIGADRGDEEAAQLLAELYEPFVRTGRPVIITDTRSAQLIKYASNTMLATRISFINEMAALCEKVGADVEAVRRGLTSDPRIGPSFLFPGVGWGGSCFGKDLSALVAMAREHGLGFDLLVRVIGANEDAKLWPTEKLRVHYNNNVRRVEFAGECNITVAVLGRSFKPRTSDTRDAPATVVIKQLIGLGATVRWCDPVVRDDLPGYCPNLYAAAEGADALILVTEWQEYRQPSYQRLKKIMRNAVLIDGRNVWSPEKAREAGCTIYSVGRP